MQALSEDRKIIEPVAIEVNASRRDRESFFFVRPLRAAGLLCLLGALTNVACADDEKKAMKLERKAVKAVEQEEIETAIALYRDVIDRFPETNTARKARERITFLSGLSHSVTSYPARTARDLMVETARALQGYLRRHGRYPDKLDDLLPKLLDESPIDPWGRPLQYRRGRNGYRLSCLGADGVGGGEDDSQDFVVVNGEFRSDPTDEGPF
jgi:hypothetical protein